MVASQDWPEVTKYAGLVCAQAHRQELIQDLFETWVDPQKGLCTGGMIRYTWLLCIASKYLVDSVCTCNIRFNKHGLQYNLFLSVMAVSCSLIELCNRRLFINGLTIFYRELLISFRRATGQKPLRIIFYRFVSCLNISRCHKAVYMYCFMEIQSASDISSR